MTEQWQELKETIIKSALKYLVKMQIAEGSVGFAVDNDHDHDCCWDDVLAWLEAQPCEDCISRQAVLDYVKDTCLDLDKYEDTEIFCDEIKAMPPVTPQYTDEEIDKAQAVEQAYVDKMVELAVEEAKRPKGKWIFHKSFDDGHKNCNECIECNQCHTWLGYDCYAKTPYCPNCGAEMSGGGEE